VCVRASTGSLNAPHIKAANIHFGWEGERFHTSWKGFLALKKRVNGLKTIYNFMQAGDVLPRLNLLGLRTTISMQMQGTGSTADGLQDTCSTADRQGKSRGPSCV